jgi:hypothetical protein
VEASLKILYKRIATRIYKYYKEIMLQSCKWGQIDSLTGRYKRRMLLINSHRPRKTVKSGRYNWYLLHRKSPIKQI